MSPTLLEHLDVQLIPQPTDVSGWAAALAMVAGFRDKTSYMVEAIAAYAGMNTYTSYDWCSVRDAIAAWDLQERSPAGTEVMEWVELLHCYGPIWLVDDDPNRHSAVLTEIYGTGTPEETLATLYNPSPLGQGAVEYKTFLELDREFGFERGRGSRMVYAGLRRRSG